jgi:glucose-6-phosphate dehydrogenase assembly protein OpcA
MGSPLEAVFATRPVEIEGIGRAMSSMWREADSLAQAAGGGAVVRARGLTLVALAADAAEFREMAPAVEAAVDAVPARAVSIALDEGAGSDLDAEVGGRCRSAGGKSFCQEHVVLRAHGSRVKDLPSLVVPLAVSDLPFVLYLPSTTLLRSDLVTRLLPIVDVLAVDTDGCADVPETLAFLRRLADVDHVIVRDLAFERLRTWREAIAEAYDEVAGHGARVTAITATCVENDAQGSLLLGWIESRFPPERRPFVRLKREAAEPSRVGAVCGIDVEIHDEEKRSEICFRQFGRHVVRTGLPEHAASCALPRPLLTEHAALTAILADAVRDRIYEESLRAAVTRAAKRS